ncbi:MAG: hypothetical protein JWN32_814 [Solirubrobacterales bacterium]|jgi:hypothetical protein|nr:hypothetical protein [Solirubrobacterales bacterium]
MTVYVYGITDAPPPPVDDLAGVEGTGVRTLVQGELAAAFASLPGPEPPAATPDALMAHERVVEALMRQRAVLPTRFGTTLPGEDDLATVLERRSASLRDLLALVRGCVEVSVRVRWETAVDPPAAADTDGRRYLESRARELREVERAVDAVHHPLARHARASTRSTPTEGGVLSASYLVAADDVRSFAEQVRRLQDADASLDLSCTGPWPPYSFVEPS